jgi:hypothetical protein
MDNFVEITVLPETKEIKETKDDTKELEKNDNYAKELGGDFPVSPETKEMKESEDDTKELKKNDDYAKEHRTTISALIVSQYMHVIDINNKEYDPIHDNYAVTFSEKDNSLLGWYVNFKEKERQNPDVYVDFDLHDVKYIESPLLCKKILSLFYRDHSDYYEHRRYLF